MGSQSAVGSLAQRTRNICKRERLVVSSTVRGWIQVRENSVAGSEFDNAGANSLDDSGTIAAWNDRRLDGTVDTLNW